MTESAENLCATARAAIETGHPSVAVDLLRRAIRAVPQDPEIATILGRALAALGHLEPAARAFDVALSLDADRIEAHLGRGSVRAAMNDGAGALVAFYHAHRLDPALERARAGLLLSFTMLGSSAVAEWYRGGALSDTAPSAAVLKDRACAFFRAGLLEAAESDLEQAEHIAPNDAETIFQRAKVYAAQGAHEAAAALYQRVISLDPHTAEAWAELGHALAMIGTLDEAETALRHALALRPGLDHAEQNLINVLIESGRHGEALNRLRRLIERSPDRPQLHNNLANLLLLLGRFREGWENYEWRRRMSSGAPRRVNLPDWRGEPLEGRPLHLIGEQGPGDAIMFASCLSELDGIDGPVHLHCEARLVSLFRRSFPWLAVTATVPGPGDHGVSLPLGSLPRLFRVDESDFARNRRFLTAEAAAVSRWRARFGELGGSLVVGISWRGGKDTVNKRQRTLALEDWLPLLTLAGVVAVDLQYGPHDDELASVLAAHGVTPHRFAEVDPLRDLDGFAAQVTALDLVVSVCNTTVHVSGGLGVPTLALAPRAPSWRWLLGRSDCPWYPSVRLIRQGEDQHWSAVLGRAAGEVSQLIAGHSLFAGGQFLPAASVPVAAHSADSVVKPAVAAR